MMAAATWLRHAMTPELWVLLLGAIGLVCVLYRRVAAWERTHLETAGDVRHVRSLDEYRERARLASTKRPGA